MWWSSTRSMAVAISMSIFPSVRFSEFIAASVPSEMPCELMDFLQAGEKQIAAGYIIYGSSTMLVYATKEASTDLHWTHHMGEFTLSHPDIRCPKDGNIYSVNQGNYFLFPEKVKKYIEGCSA